MNDLFGFEQPLPLHYERIDLKSPFSPHLYQKYVKLYVQFYQEYPNYRDIVFMRSEEKFEKLSTEKSGVREIQIDGKWAGIIAATPGRNRFLSGYIINEEILAIEFRGQNFALAIRRKLIDQLPDDSIIYGEIDARNVPSIKTAVRVGRENVGNYFFVDVG